MEVNNTCAEKSDAPRGRDSLAGGTEAEEEKRKGVETENRQHVIPRVPNGARRRRSSAGTTGAEPSHGSKNEECTMEPTQSSNDLGGGGGHSRSHKESSTSASLLPNAEFKSTTGKTSGNVAIPVPRSTSGRGEINDSQPPIAIEAKKKSRRKSSKSRSRVSSSIPVRTDESSRHRNRSSPPPHSAGRIEPDLQEEAVTACPSSQGSSSVQGTKRRKRMCSSKTLSTRDTEKDREKCEPVPHNTHSGGSTLDVSYCCPNATSSATDERNHDVPEIPTTAIEPTSDAAMDRRRKHLLADHEQAPGLDQHPTEIGPTIGSSINILNERPRDRETGREESASPAEWPLEGQRRKTRRRHDVAARGIKAGRWEKDGADGVVQRRQRSSGSKKDKPPKGKPAAAVVDPPPPQALSVEVIDRGAMKQLVLSADDTTAMMGRPKIGRDRSSPTPSSRDGSSKGPRTQHVDVRSPGQGQKLLHRRRPFPRETGEEERTWDTGEEKRSKEFRDTFTTAVLAGVEDKTHPADAGLGAAADQDKRTRPTCRQTPPTARPSQAKERPSQQAPPRHHDDHRRRSPRISGHRKTGADCAGSRDSSPRMAPSFSVLQNTEDRGQPRAPSPRMKIDVPPEISFSRGNLVGAESSSSTSSSSSALGRPGPERTAMYISQQESFHADLSDDFAGLNSPVGELCGKGGREAGGSRRGGRAGDDGNAKGDQPRVASLETGTITSRTGAICGSSSAPTVDDARPATSGSCTGTLAPHEMQQEQAATPMAATKRPSPEAMWERRTGGERNGRQEVTTGAAPGVGASINAAPVGDPKPPPSMHPNKIHEAVAEREEGRISSDPDGVGQLERGATPPLSQVRSDEPNEHAEEGCCRAGKDLVHFRTDVSRHLVSGERPVLFFLRHNENLAVTRVEGAGRLLMTLREEAGAEVVAVDGAIVHDSAAHFGDAAINTDHRFPYVAGHRYEFQVVPAQGVELAVRGNVDRQGTAASHMSQAKRPPTTGLHVAFSVTSTYSKGARLCDEDAMQVSLPTFEATPPKASDRHPATLASSAPAATKRPQPSSTVVVAADGRCSSPKSCSQGPASSGDRGLSRGTAAEALASPYVSPQPLGVGQTATSQTGVDASAQRPGDPASAPVPKAPAVNSSDRVHRGNAPSQLAARPAHSETSTGAIERDKPLAGRLGWNTAWEKQDLLPSSSTPAEASRQTPESTLPYIRRHTEQSSHRPGLEPQDSSGYAGNFARTDSTVRADGCIRPTAYFDHDPPVQSMRHVVPSGAEEETHALRYHRPAREQQYNAPPAYSPGPYRVGNAAEAVWNQPRHLDTTLTAVSGGGSNWGGRANDTFGSTRHGEGKTSAGNYEHGRWRGPVTEGQAPHGGPVLSTRSELDGSRASDWSGYENGQYNTGARPNGDEDLRRHRFHNSSERGKEPPSSRSGNGHVGYTHGGGSLPPPGEPRWEHTNTIGISHAETSWGGALAARCRIPMGRGVRGGAPGSTLTREEVHRSRKRDGFLGSLAAEKARSGVGYVADLGDGEQARSSHVAGQHRTRQHAPGSYHQPPANRTFRHGNRGGVTADAANRAERMPQRWIKF